MVKCSGCGYEFDDEGMCPCDSCYWYKIEKAKIDLQVHEKQFGKEEEKC